MLRDLGIFAALVFMLFAILAVFNARVIIRCVDNNKDLENKMVNRIKMAGTFVSLISLYIIAVLIKMG